MRLTALRSLPASLPPSFPPSLYPQSIPRYDLHLNPVLPDRNPLPPPHLPPSLRPYPVPRYDCIWIQWCLLYVTDADVRTVMDRARVGLKPDGLVIVKENVCREGFVVDNDDSSLTRCNAYMLDLFEKSNMQVR